MAVVPRCVWCCGTLDTSESFHSMIQTRFKGYTFCSEECLDDGEAASGKESKAHKAKWKAALSP